MKHLVIIIAVFFINLTALSAQVSKTIYLNTVKDSVEFLFKKYYTDTYILQDKRDSLYIKTIITFNTDMGIHHPSAHYIFKDSIPDGFYKIIIDGKPMEKITFVNNKKNGFNCFYTFQDFYLTREYLNDNIIEYNEIDSLGNVLESNPKNPSFDFPSNDVKTKRMDLLNFCKN